VQAAYPELLPLLQSKLGGGAWCNGGLARLTTSAVLCVLSLATIYALPSWSIPLSWMFAGTSLFGLSSVAVSCANNSFSENHFINHALGWICSIPLLMPFEAWVVHSQTADWRMQEANFMKRIVTSNFWLFSSVAEWGRCQVSYYITRKRILGNIALMWAGYAILLPVIISWLGWTGFGKYFFMPWVVYHMWRSIALRSKYRGSAIRMPLDNATMADLLSAFADEFPDTKLSVPVVGQILYEANRNFRKHANIGVRFMEKLFGWETINSFPTTTVGDYDPSSPRSRGMTRRKPRSLSTLLRDDDTGLFAQFGGQAADYFDELVIAFNRKVRCQSGTSVRSRGILCGGLTGGDRLCRAAPPRCACRRPWPAGWSSRPRRP
jgi:hypothetical protein